MSYTIFEKKNTRSGSPTVTFTKLGRIALNAAATHLCHKNAVEFVLLMWDEDNLRIGLKPTSSKRDNRAYKITYGSNNSGAAFSAKSFLDFVGWDFSVKHSVEAEWNEDDGIFEVKLKPEYLKDARQRKLLPVEGGKRQAK